MDADIIIVGAGASGLTAGIAAAREGASALILEQKEKPGRKIYVTGNGRCNFTNRFQSAECYRGEEPDFAVRALKRFGADQTIELFRELGIREREIGGYVYPYSGQAKDVVSVLLAELERLRVTIRCGLSVTKLERFDDGPGGYRVWAGEEYFQAKAVILAAGGCASPKFGSDGSGYRLAGQLGHTLIHPAPALVQLWTGEKTKEISGVRFIGRGTLYRGSLYQGAPKTEDFLASEQGEFLFTDYGISGIPILQMSRFASKELEQGRMPELRLSFLPELTKEECGREVGRRFSVYPERSALQALTGLIHEKLIRYLFRVCGIDGQEAARGISAEKRNLLAKALSGFKLQIIRTNSFENAQVSAGGIPTGEVGDDMESEISPGLYLAGELLDVDGTCGGYNLQWAWTSGWLAGKAAAGTAAGDRPQGRRKSAGSRSPEAGRRPGVNKTPEAGRRPGGNKAPAAGQPTEAGRVPAGQKPPCGGLKNKNRKPSDRKERGRKRK